MEEGQDHSEIRRGKSGLSCSMATFPREQSKVYRNPQGDRVPGGFTRWSRRAADGPSDRPNAGDSRSAVCEALGHGLEATFRMTGD